MQIEITVREVYGTAKAYPANQAARNLAALELAQALGHTVTQTAGPAWADHIA